MDKQQELAHGQAAETFSMDMQHRKAARTCDTDIMGQQVCSRDMQHGPAMDHDMQH
jgi:hypothetical protein